MSQHSQRTHFGPSRASIVLGAGLVLASSLATGYMISGLELRLRDLMGFALGVGFTGLLAYHVLVMVSERAVARERAERETQRAAAQERQESAGSDELTRWQNAAAGLLDAYLGGRAVDFHGEPVPEYVRARLADCFDTYAEPPQEPYIQPDPDVTSTWLADPEPEEPLGYRADPQRPWVPADERAFNAFEPGNTSVAVPLPPREPEPFRPQPTYPVSPGHQEHWVSDETQVITQPSEAQTEMIDRVR